MRSLLNHTITYALVLGLLGLASCRSHTTEWRDLLDSELSQFEVWMGVPHASIDGLPEGTYKSDNVHNGTPMGLNADVKEVFSVYIEGDEPVLKVSGEIYGGLTTLEEFENYHLRVQVKWGDRKWEPRLDKLRDSGLLYHCHGEHGKFWKVWKACLEFQVQETDLGDFIGLGGAKGDVRSRKDGEGTRPVYDRQSEDYHSGYISAYPEPDQPHGEWNQLDLYVIGNRAIHVVNGELVMAVENARRKDGSSLTRGQLQLQSEAAEVHYKRLKIRPLAQFPERLLDLVSWQSAE
ncbi:MULTISPECIES: DUF1080 domain-containing protein [unclassified Lentimonas]|uniref:3-keto-disaccharide hydrolase n=1 Tax=unclassified Lentimonas TaxID=2630993 RepID=UPI001320858E|nr:MULTISPECIES: DUF1080 domain-containing protein [unclassified Lentimonas]CAA6680223.1 Unannotated [Lentimonas sp. CC4]CAA6687504.1 Unannotated [Lentimonas sp. CC6]CAA7076160.1 Unannotated [Lentimonas sp. CC4]CAA7171973.1 Unannotated [Lentimonas sp. CC21]CAA7183181.1 Unannotated [Lentimonas sp. CC8]